MAEISRSQGWQVRHGARLEEGGVTLAMVPDIVNNHVHSRAQWEGTDSWMDDLDIEWGRAGPTPCC